MRPTTIIAISKGSIAFSTATLIAGIVLFLFGGAAVWVMDAKRREANTQVETSKTNADQVDLYATKLANAQTGYNTLVNNVISLRNATLVDGNTLQTLALAMNTASSSLLEYITSVSTSLDARDTDITGLMNNLNADAGYITNALANAEVLSNSVLTQADAVDAINAFFTPHEAAGSVQQTQWNTQIQPLIDQANALSASVNAELTHPQTLRQQVDQSIYQSTAIPHIVPVKNGLAIVGGFLTANLLTPNGRIAVRFRELTAVFTWQCTNADLLATCTAKSIWASKPAASIRFIATYIMTTVGDPHLYVVVRLNDPTLSGSIEVSIISGNIPLLDSPPPVSFTIDAMVGGSLTTLPISRTGYMTDLDPSWLPTTFINIDPTVYDPYGALTLCAAYAQNMGLSGMFMFRSQQLFGVDTIRCFATNIGPNASGPSRGDDLSPPAPFYGEGTYGKAPMSFTTPYFQSSAIVL